LNEWFAGYVASGKIRVVNEWWTGRDGRGSGCSTKGIVLYCYALEIRKLKICEGS
jgi:hypothetical protein